MRFTVKLFHVRFVTNSISLHLIVNYMDYMPTTRQWEIKSQWFGRQYTQFFPDFLRAQNMVRVIEGKII